MLLIYNCSKNYFFQDAVHSFSGGLDNTLKMYDFNSNSGEGNYISSFNLPKKHIIITRLQYALKEHNTNYKNYISVPMCVSSWYPLFTLVTTQFSFGFYVLMQYK